MASMAADFERARGLMAVVMPELPDDLARRRWSKCVGYMTILNLPDVLRQDSVQRQYFSPNFYPHDLMRQPPREDYAGVRKVVDFRTTIHRDLDFVGGILRRETDQSTLRHVMGSHPEVGIEDVMGIDLELRYAPKSQHGTESRAAALAARETRTVTGLDVVGFSGDMIVARWVKLDPAAQATKNATVCA